MSETSPSQSEPTLRMWLDGPHSARVQLAGTLDGGSGGWLADLTEAAPSLGIERLVVELSGVVGFDGEGAKALSHCRHLAAAAATTLVFWGRAGAGRDVLLVSMAAC
ncbi:MAG: hypothetical protein ACYDB7_07660 [Mycobacteriales bacterium]